MDYIKDPVLFFTIGQFIRTGTIFVSDTENNRCLMTVFVVNKQVITSGNIMELL